MNDDDLRWPGDPGGRVTTTMESQSHDEGGGVGDDDDDDEYGGNAMMRLSYPDSQPVLLTTRQ